MWTVTESCTSETVPAAQLHNRLGIDNDEQGGMSGSAPEPRDSWRCGAFGAGVAKVSSAQGPTTRPSCTAHGGVEDDVLLLMLVMPAALLLMLCALGRYEQLIEAPSRSLVHGAEPESPVAVSGAELISELGTDLAPEAA
jgi:hypothetical protein